MAAKRMTYSVKEMFLTLQGEGTHAGRPAVFVRFTGCNLWSGREMDRHKAQCQFCDTEFVGMDGQNGGQFSAPQSLADAAAALWPEGGRPFVVCTGGEPLLQLDPPLINALHDAGFEIAVETNGTLPAPKGIDWLCVSPKAGTKLAQRSGDELKLVYPQEGQTPADYEMLDFSRFVLQPMDGPDVVEYTAIAVEYCLSHPQWGLSLQTHKWIGIS
jgi:7-carboxy-7-deazaguanine synthase